MFARYRPQSISETSRRGSRSDGARSTSATTSSTSVVRAVSAGKRTATLSAPVIAKATTASHPIELGAAPRATAWPPKNAVTTTLVARTVPARCLRPPSVSACARTARTASS